MVAKNEKIIKRSAPERLVLAWPRLPNNSIGFAGIDYQDIDRHGVWVRLRRNERENLSIQTK